MARLIKIWVNKQMDSASGDPVRIISEAEEAQEIYEKLKSELSHETLNQLTLLFIRNSEMCFAPSAD